MTFKEYYRDMVDKGIISTELQGQKDLETWNEIHLQKERDKADGILYLWKIVAQSVSLLADDNPMQYEKLPDCDILFFFWPLTKFRYIGGN